MLVHIIRIVGEQMFAHPTMTEDSGEAKAIKSLF